MPEGSMGPRGTYEAQKLASPLRSRWQLSWQRCHGGWAAEMQQPRKKRGKRECEKARTNKRMMQGSRKGMAGSEPMAEPGRGRHTQRYTLQERNHCCWILELTGVSPKPSD